MQPIIIFGHWSAPNPWKVILICKELDIPYDLRVVELSDTKSPPLTDINPNGRLPAIQDPNTGVQLWESGAIILYLIEQYDADHRISFADTAQRLQTQQWLFFQVSGQGPYFGQLAWFARFHPEKLPSAIERYTKEVERVIGVLDRCLANAPWLVGDRCTYADLSFVTWSHVADGLLKQLGKATVLENHPHYSKWLRNMENRPRVGECIMAIAKGREEHGLPP